MLSHYYFSIKRNFNWPFAVLFISMLFSPVVQAQSLAYVANRESSNITVINTENHQASATIAVGAGPHGVALTPNGTLAYVVNQLSNSVSVIETAGNTVISTISVGNNPYGLAITPNGSYAYVANRGSDTVSVIAIASNTVIATVPVGDGPKKVAITPSGAFAYVTNEHSNTVSVIALSSNTVSATIPVGIIPIGIAITPNGAKAYVANATSNDVSVIDTASNLLIATIPVGVNPQSVAITPNGAFAYVTNYVSNTLSVINTTNNTIVSTISNVSSPVGLDISPNGAFVYATSFQTNAITIINTASNAVSGTIAVGTGPVAVNFMPPSSSNSPFIKVDTATQGNWQSAYGADGHHIINHSVSYPTYAELTASSQAAWTWANSTTDIRALQTPAGNTRIAATWYSATAFTLNLVIHDGNTHQVALYFLDWDNVGRTQTVEIINTQTGAILDTRTVSAFANGKYLVWNLSGQVTLKVTRTAGHNAVLSGIFFGTGGGSNQAPLVTLNTPNNGTMYIAPASINLSATATDHDGTISRVDFYAGPTLIGSGTGSPYTFLWNNVPAGNYILTAKATDNTGAISTSGGVNISVSDNGTFALFLNTDLVTQGNWRNNYGVDGYHIVNDAISYPSYAQVTPTGQGAWTWEAATSDLRALQRTNTGRIAATWFNNTSFSIEFNLSDGVAHQVALYFLDWDNAGRAQTVEILNTQTGAILDTRTVSAFANGKYLVWNLSGQVTLRITRTAGHNAVLSGIFFGGG